VRDAKAAEIKAKGQTSKNPWRESFGNPANLKYVVIATIIMVRSRRGG